MIEVNHHLHAMMPATASEDGGYVPWVAISRGFFFIGLFVRVFMCGSKSGDQRPSPRVRAGR